MFSIESIAAEDLKLGIVRNEPVNLNLRLSYKQSRIIATKKEEVFLSLQIGK